MIDESNPLERKAAERAYIQYAQRLVELARAGNVDAFGAFVLRDEAGGHIDISPLHKSWTRFVDYAWERDKYAGILSAWRHGKSLLGTIRLALWEIGKNPEIRVRIICADDDEAILRVAAIQRFLTSPEYLAVFPHIRPSSVAEVTKHRMFVERKSLGPDPTLQAAGVFTSEAGGGNDLILIDDVVTFQNAIMSPAKRQQVYDALTSVWLRRIVPTTRVLYVGTAWHYDDASHQLMRQGGGKWLWLKQSVSDDFEEFDCEVLGNPE